MKTWTVILYVISLAYWKCLSGDICNTTLIANNNVSEFDYWLSFEEPEMMQAKRQKSLFRKYKSFTGIDGPVELGLMLPGHLFMAT